MSAMRSMTSSDGLRELEWGAEIKGWGSVLAFCMHTAYDWSLEHNATPLTTSPHSSSKQDLREGLTAQLGSPLGRAAHCVCCPSCPSILRGLMPNLWRPPPPKAAKTKQKGQNPKLVVLLPSLISQRHLINTLFSLPSKFQIWKLLDLMERWGQTGMILSSFIPAQSPPANSEEQPAPAC